MVDVGGCLVVTDSRSTLARVYTTRYVCVSVLFCGVGSWVLVAGDVENIRHKSESVLPVATILNSY